MGESNERASWYKVGQRSQKSMEGCMRKPRIDMSTKKFGRTRQKKRKKRIEIRKRRAL